MRYGEYLEDRLIYLFGTQASIPYLYGGNIYSPLFYFLFKPLFLIPPTFYFIIMLSCFIVYNILIIIRFDKLSLIYLLLASYFEFRMLYEGNIQPFLMVILLLNWNSSKNYEGLIIGLLSFKIPVIIVGIYRFLMTGNKKLLIGLILGILINWIWLFILPGYLDAFLHDAYFYDELSTVVIKYGFYYVCLIDAIYNRQKIFDYFSNYRNSKKKQKEIINWINSEYEEKMEIPDINNQLNNDMDKSS